MLWIWPDGGARIKALLAVLRPWNAKKKKKSLRNDVKVAGFSMRDDKIALVMETRGVWRYVITCQRSPIIKTGGRLWAFDIAAPMKAAYLAEPEAGGKLRRGEEQGGTQSGDEAIGSSGNNSDCDRCRNTPSLRPAAPLVPIEMETVAGLPGGKFSKVLVYLSNASDWSRGRRGLEKSFTTWRVFDHIASQHPIYWDFRTVCGTCNFMQLCSYACDLSNIRHTFSLACASTPDMDIVCISVVFCSFGHHCCNSTLKSWLISALVTMEAFFALFEHNWQQFPRVHGINKHLESSNCNKLNHANATIFTLFLTRFSQTL